MPITRKIIRVGTSRAVSLPKSWLAFYERKYKQSIKEVSLEVNGKLVIRPIIENKLMPAGGRAKGISQKLRP